MNQEEQEKLICLSCGLEIQPEEAIKLDGEILCKECFDLLEASKDTH